MTKNLVTYLESFITDHKKQLFDRILEDRTKYITVAVENVYHAHNASAILRSCDCFGIQDIHAMEGEVEFDFNPNEKIDKKASKWLDVYHYKYANSTKMCLDSLKSQGYKIVATSPHSDSHTLKTLPINQKVALFLGTEKRGLSNEVLEAADYKLNVEMYGFTESLNVSVCAAICLYELKQRLIQSDLNWRLTDEEKLRIRYDWIRKSLERPDLMEQEFYRRNE